jgi:hypothetical protein
VLTHAVAGTLDLDDDGMVQQPVEQRGGDVALSGAGRAQQMDDLGSFDEVEAG